MSAVLSATQLRDTLDTRLLPLSFQSLLSLGLITQTHHDQALLRKDMVAVESESEALLWLLSRGIVGEAELDALLDRLALPSEDEARRHEKLGIVKGALYIADGLVRSFMREPLDALLALDLINADQHQAGCELRPTVAEGVAGTPAGALALLKNRGIVTERQFNFFKAEALRAPLQPETLERNAIVMEADRIFQRIVGNYVDGLWAGVWRGLLLLLVPAAAVGGLLVWLR